MGEAFHVWRLCEGDDAKRGLACDENGLRLGGVALIERSDAAYRIRPEEEVSRLLAIGYGAGMDGVRLMPGLAVIARALGSGNLCLARIAAVQLRMPDLPDALARAELQLEAAMLRLEFATPHIEPARPEQSQPHLFRQPEFAAHGCSA